jgi:hypothetical protein
VRELVKERADLAVAGPCGDDDLLVFAPAAGPVGRGLADLDAVPELVCEFLEGRDQWRWLSPSTPLFAR